ncbi:hypothetical protein AB832_05350 [Flavobacteriaceae bacterium (ex Bugula neritina AB1)]|nr:hypothetical protein AB832_05350 [Flavobacteriaceae bacterium (ex Bugula neritina AB1)]
MYRIFLIFLVFISLSCAREVEPNATTINKIFASKDFTFEFHNGKGNKESLSFRQDYLVYKSNKPTVRREVTYDEVLLINDFIQKIVDLHSQSLNKETNPHYIIKNTAYKSIIIPEQEDFYFEALIKTLKLK